MHRNVWNSIMIVYISKKYILSRKHQTPEMPGTRSTSWGRPGLDRCLPEFPVWTHVSHRLPLKSCLQTPTVCLQSSPVLHCTCVFQTLVYLIMSPGDTSYTMSPNTYSTPYTSQRLLIIHSCPLFPTPRSALPC